jgi:hypothetical protein
MTSDFPSGAERSNETRDTGDDNAFARLEKEMANMRDAIGGLLIRFRTRQPISARLRKSRRNVG